MDWFLYDSDLPHEKIKSESKPVMLWKCYEDILRLYEPQIFIIGYTFFNKQLGLLRDKVLE